MNETRIEIEEVRFTLHGDGSRAHRSETIARLTMDYLGDLLEREFQHLDADVTLGQLRVPPIHAPLDALDDGAVARLCAEAAHRALLASG